MTNIDHVANERRTPHPILALDEFGARSRDGRGLIELTRTEFALLHFLAYLPPGKVAEYDVIGRALRPHEHAPVSNKVVRDLAARIRRKVCVSASYTPPDCQPWPHDIIITRRDFGLRLNWSYFYPPESGFQQNTSVIASFSRRMEQ